MMRDVTSVWSIVLIEEYLIVMCTLHQSLTYVATRQHSSSLSSMRCTRSVEDKVENNVTNVFGIVLMKLIPGEHNGLGASVKLSTEALGRSRCVRR